MENYNLDNNDLDLDEIAVFLDRLFKNNTSNNTSLFGVSNINFVFDIKDIDEICNSIEKHKEIDCLALRKWLISINDRYTKVTNDDLDDNKDLDDEGEEYRQIPIYIRVSDYKKFFMLIQKIQRMQDKIYRHNRGISGRRLIETMWLRMGPGDINDVIMFLERQIEFLKNDNFFPTYMMHYGDTDNLRVCYINEDNDLWFETNKHICFYLGDVNNISDFGNYYGMYRLPAIHYGLVNENGELVCYIYGIQNLGNNNQNIISTFSEGAKNELYDNKRKFGRLRVSRDHPLALVYFFELLEQKGITKIKVPTLQVFNHDYHVELSNDSEKYFSIYTSDEIAFYEKQISNGLIGEEERRYIRNRDYYNQFHNKEDLISENKTDRLIYYFSLVAEKLGVIEILNEPFFNGDEYLMVEIKSRGMDKYAVYGFEGYGR